MKIYMIDVSHIPRTCEHQKSCLNKTDLTEMPENVHVQSVQDVLYLNCIFCTRGQCSTTGGAHT